MSHPRWWDEMDEVAREAGHATFSVEWYRSMRDQHRERFPDSDARSKQNMDLMVEWAERGR